MCVLSIPENSVQNRVDRDVKLSQTCFCKIQLPISYVAQLPCFFSLFACIVGTGCTIHRLTATRRITTAIGAPLDRASVVSAILVTRAS